MAATYTVKGPSFDDLDKQQKHIFGRKHALEFKEGFRHIHKIYELSDDDYEYIDFIAGHVGAQGVTIVVVLIKDDNNATYNTLMQKTAAVCAFRMEVWSPGSVQLQVIPKTMPQILPNSPNYTNALFTSKDAVIGKGVPYDEFYENENNTHLTRELVVYIQYDSSVYANAQQLAYTNQDDKRAQFFKMLLYMGYIRPSPGMTPQLKTKDMDAFNTTRMKVTFYERPQAGLLNQAVADDSYEFEQDKLLLALNKPRERSLTYSYHGQDERPSDYRYATLKKGAAHLQALDMNYFHNFVASLPLRKDIFFKDFQSLGPPPLFLAGIDNAPPHVGIEPMAAILLAVQHKMKAKGSPPESLYGIAMRTYTSPAKCRNDLTTFVNKVQDGLAVQYTDLTQLRDVINLMRECTDKKYTRGELEMHMIGWLLNRPIKVFVGGDDPGDAEFYSNSLNTFVAQLAVNAPTSSPSFKPPPRITDESTTLYLSRLPNTTKYVELTKIV